MPPSKAEVELVSTLLNEDEWRENVWGEVVYNKPQWFEALDANGLWVKWLESDNEILVNMALRMLGLMARNSGCRVAALLRMASDLPDPWSSRVATVLRWNDTDKVDDDLFELQMELYSKGFDTVGTLMWDRIAEKHPRRGVRILQLQIRKLLAKGRELRLAQAPVDIGAREFRERGAETAVRTCAARSPYFTWKSLARECLHLDYLRVWARRNYGKGGFDSPISRCADRCRDLLKVSEMALVSAGRAIARRDPQRFKKLVALCDSRPKSRRSERCLLRSMNSLPIEEADYALTWLISKPRRFQLGESSGPWAEEWPARQLIKKFSPVCSAAVFAQLEAAILAYRDPMLKRLQQSVHTRVMRGEFYPNYHGQSQYVLLSSAPTDRLSVPGRDQRGVWERKFGSWPALPASRSGSGFVGSTIPTVKLDLISDAQWLKIASGNWSTGRFNHKVMGPGHLGEASHMHFASDVGAMTRRQPARFARLALRLPLGCPPNYLEQILRAFEQKDAPEILTKAREQNAKDPKRVERLEAELSAWRPASRDEIEAVISKLPMPCESETAKAVCWLIDKRDDIRWSKSTIVFVEQLATTHPNPGPNEFGVHSSGGKDSEEMVPDVSMSGLNCVRGAAAIAVQHLLYADPQLYDDLQPAIEGLASDSHIAVRSAAIATCIPVLNIDRNKAVAHFLSICSVGDDRVFLSPYLDEFLRYALWSHPEELMRIVNRMANSKLPEVAKNGAAWATAAWLHKGLHKGLVDTCVIGSEAQRRGVAEVLGESPWEDSTASRRIEMIPPFFEDPEKEVSGAAARIFWKDEVWKDQRIIPLALAFLKTKAFAVDPAPIIRGVSEVHGPIGNLVPIVLGIAEQFAGPLATAARDFSQGVAADVTEVFKLLLKLYQEAQDNHDRKLQAACLDMWDALLKAGVGSYREADGLLDSVER